MDKSLEKDICIFERIGYMSHGNQEFMIKTIINDFINQGLFKRKLFSIINIILFPLFTISNRLNFHESVMAEKIYECFHKQTKSE